MDTVESIPPQNHSKSEIPFNRVPAGHTDDGGVPGDAAVFVHLGYPGRQVRPPHRPRPLHQALLLNLQITNRGYRLIQSSPVNMTLMVIGQKCHINFNSWFRQFSSFTVNIRTQKVLLGDQTTAMLNMLQILHYPRSSVLKITPPLSVVNGWKDTLAGKTVVRY